MLWTKIRVFAQSVRVIVETSPYNNVIWNSATRTTTIGMPLGKNEYILTVGSYIVQWGHSTLEWDSGYTEFTLGEFNLSEEIRFEAEIRIINNMLHAPLEFFRRAMGIDLAEIDGVLSLTQKRSEAAD